MTRKENFSGRGVSQALINTPKLRLKPAGIDPHMHEDARNVAQRDDG